MSFDFSIDHDSRFMEVTVSGPIGLEEIRTHLFTERLKGGLSYDELIDARDAESTVSTAQVREIFSLLSDFGRESALGPTAVVVSSDLAYGMLRMLEIMLEEVCIVKPFRDYDTAVQWLQATRESVT